MRAVKAIRDNQLERFCLPQGDADGTRRLAWRRSAVRLQILLALRRERACEELSYLIDHLGRATESTRHRALAAPEMALYISALLNETIPDADIAVPVLARVAALSSAPASQKFSWTGVLPLDYLPLGERIIRVPGGTLNNPELTLNSDQIRLSSPSDGATVEVAIRTPGQPLESCLFRSDRLELVDAWRPFSDLFNDGNLSLNLDPSSRAAFLTVLDEAVELIKVVMPAALEEMVETAQYLSPIRPKDTETNALPSFSSPTLPGVIFVGIERGDGRLIDARHLAESCVHEHLHNRLYLLDEALPLTVQTANPRSYFSPWKQTMRTIEGMLHAVYVFSHLAWFWRNVGEKINHLAQYADHNVAEQIEHLKIATAEIDTDELTPAGRCVLSASTEIIASLTRASAT
ncbi:MAG: HEXXH motif-containing putative peptide modification protein [Acidobacteriota bacterium]|nr:HEXXH motif-containing putative peptide modification protein [Acidobacteriota bacterium]